MRGYIDPIGAQAIAGLNYSFFARSNDRDRRIPTACIIASHGKMSKAFQ